VNGLIASLGDKADADSDEIALDGTLIREREDKIYLLLNKPRGYVTTLSDERGRPTVAELVSGCGRRVYPVGRLDMNSEGLLLLTDDGAFANRMAHPSHRTEKEYHVKVTGNMAGVDKRLMALRALEDGTPIVPAYVRILRTGDGGGVLSVVIHQGLNRQVRRMCAQVGLAVRRLKRVREGSLLLGDLVPGSWRRLTREEVEELLQ